MVEYRLAKARVAGSNPVSCFFYCLGNLVNTRLPRFFVASKFESAAFAVLHESCYGPIRGAVGI